jgi:cysteine desulfurase family protein
MAYFDNSATTYPKPKIFYDTLIEKFEAYGVNGSRGKYEKASAIKEIVKENRNILSSKEFFNITDSERIIFTSSATVALNQVLQGLDYKSIKNVYISPFEHNAVYRTILFLQNKHKFNLEILPFDAFEYNENKAKIYFESKKPDLTILTHASNVFGNILPVKKIFDLSKKYNSVTVLDVAQTAGCYDVDLNELNADFACFAGHKNLFGPTGIGGIAYNSDIILSPILFGGTGVNSEEEDMPLFLPERLEVGSMNSLSLIGLNISLKWLTGTGLDKISRSKLENLSNLFDLFKDYEDIKIVSKKENNIGVVSVLFDGYSPQEMAKFLNKEGISIREGLHCAPLAHKHIGTFPKGTARFSVSYLNNKTDFIELKAAMDNIL